MRIILASQSPRRKQLLSRLARMLSFAFEVIEPNIPEESNTKNAVAHTRILANKKAAAVYLKIRTAATASTLTPYLIIGADTVVSFNKQILEKPQSPEDAYRMISRLSAKKHEVISTVSLLFPPNPKPLVITDQTTVTFRKLNDTVIRRYCEWDDWKDYAGAYNIDSLGSCLIEGIKGNVTTVMGLPIHKLYDVLQRSLPTMQAKQ